jgi:hypothetical protein
MRSTPSNLGRVELSEEPLDEAEYIAVATELLQQMFCELRSLATGNPALARALSTRGANARACLWTLCETVELLKAADDPSMANSLRRRATGLISWLSDEVDELALCATGNDSADAFRVAVH